jgi:DNA-binding response OmpR family regulator
MRPPIISQRILLIQDDADAAKTIIEALAQSRDAPFKVEWVRRCSEGLEMLDGIGAILVDLNLPDSRGIETFDRVYLGAAGIPILILTNSSDESTAKLAVQCGAQDYLFKSRIDAYLLPKTLGSMIERATYAEALLRGKSARRSLSTRSATRS